MPFSDVLAERVQKLLSRKRGLSTKTLFGGKGFLIQGNMCCGVWREFLIVRVGKDAYEQALAEPDVRKFDMTGRSMRGWVMIPESAVADHETLEAWVDQGFRFAKTLPAKAD